MSIKMKDEAICPHCNNKIFFVIEDRLQHIIHRVYPEGDDFQYEYQDDGDIMGGEFYCPNCDTKLGDLESELVKLFTN